MIFCVFLSICVRHPSRIATNRENPPKICRSIAKSNAPEGQKPTAQRQHLGFKMKSDDKRPKRAKAITQLMCFCPHRANNCTYTIPRAVPWAICVLAFQAVITCYNLLFCPSQRSMSEGKSNCNPTA